MMELGVVEEVRLRKKRESDLVLATGVDVKMEEFSDTEVSSRQASMRVGPQRSPLPRRRALRRSPVAGHRVFDATEDLRRQRRVAFLEKGHAGYTASWPILEAVAVSVCRRQKHCVCHCRSSR